MSLALGAFTLLAARGCAGVDSGIGHLILGRSATDAGDASEGER